MKFHKVIKDTWHIFCRSLLLVSRDPARPITALFQPLCFLFLFAPLLESLIKASNLGSANYLNLFTPGLLVMVGMYSTAFSGFGLIADIRAGVIERMRVTPISRTALLLGRSLKDTLILLLQSIFLILLTLLLGLKASIIGIILTLILISFVGLLISSFSYIIALAMKNEHILAPVIMFFLLPLQLLSGILLPLSLAPQWIQKAALFNPLAYVVNAARQLFNGNFNNADVYTAFGIMIILSILSIYLTSKSFKKSTL